MFMIACFVHTFQRYVQRVHIWNVSNSDINVREKAKTAENCVSVSIRYRRQTTLYLALSGVLDMAQHSPTSPPPSCLMHRGVAFFDGVPDVGF